MNHGLTERDLQQITEATSRFPEIQKLILFGSRAKGTHKLGSDVDLAIQGSGLDRETAIRLSGLLNEEKPLPYFFDVVHYDTLASEDLRAHIDRVGVVLWQSAAPKKLYLLFFLLPLLAILCVPFYNRVDPTFFGIPFFYAYQLFLIPVTAVITAFVYHRVKEGE